MCTLSVFHVQFNVIDRNVLIDAQKNHRKKATRGLLIRVAAYTAYFVELGQGDAGRYYLTHPPMPPSVLTAQTGQTEGSP